MSTIGLILIFLVANSITGTYVYTHQYVITTTIIKLSCFIYADFIEVPTNVTVPEGSEEGAVFRCSHMSTDAFINWIIDNLPVDNLNYPDVVDRLSIENGLRVSMLIVPATLRYNGSLVVCVAFVNGNQMITPPATLTVVAGWFQ